MHDPGTDRIDMDMSTPLLPPAELWDTFTDGLAQFATFQPKRYAFLCLPIPMESSLLSAQRHFDECPIGVGVSRRHLHQGIADGHLRWKTVGAPETSIIGVACVKPGHTLSIHHPNGAVRLSRAILVVADDRGMFPWEVQERSAAEQEIRKAAAQVERAVRARNLDRWQQATVSRYGKILGGLIVLWRTVSPLPIAPPSVMTAVLHEVKDEPRTSLDIVTMLKRQYGTARDYYPMLWDMVDAGMLEVASNSPPVRYAITAQGRTHLESA